MGESKAELTRESGGRKSAARTGTFELKSRRFSLLGLVLHSADMAEIAAEQEMLTDGEILEMITQAKAA